jgi:hypothetical protein
MDELDAIEASAEGDPVALAEKRTLSFDWSKYIPSDKSDCIGMVTTGGPASYVELLSCVEILRDARNIRNADVLEATMQASARAAANTGKRNPTHRACAKWLGGRYVHGTRQPDSTH